MFASSIQPRPASGYCALISVIALAGISDVSAHEGPPFPILMDQPLADYVVSVWADPDIGDAQFFIVLESADGGPPGEAPNNVTMWIEPVSGRLDRVTVIAEQQSLRNQMQFEANPFFDRQDHWNVGIQLTNGNGETLELRTQVESTPPGYGPWGLAIYLFPFLFLAGFWVMAMMRRNARIQDLTEKAPNRIATTPQSDRVGQIGDGSTSL